MENETTYLCTDGHCEIEIDAPCAQSAAEEYVASYFEPASKTTWVTVHVWESSEADDEGDSYSIPIAPDVPDCTGPQHDWQSPHEIVRGGLESPGVVGHGGGVTIHTVCAHCGAHQHVDTWAQDSATGEQGLCAVEYCEPDEESLDWADRT